MAESLETILVVDDAADELGAVVSLLKSADFHVLEADGATAAIELATTYEGSIELLLADLKMEVLSGRNLVNEMKKSRPEIQMLFISPMTGGDLLAFNHQWILIEKASVPSKLLEIVTDVLRSPDSSPAINPYDMRRVENTMRPKMVYRSYAARKSSKQRLESQK